MTNRPALLVIDDQAEIGAFIRRVAEPMGYEVTIVTTPEDWRAAYEQHHPEAIILDIVMPRVDGIEVLRGLAATRCSSRILLVTGFKEDYLAFADQLAEAFGLPSVAALTKPIRVDDLRSFLRGE